MDPAVAAAAQQAIAQAIAAGAAVSADAPVVAAEPEPTKKKSRWGSKEEDPAVAPAKKSRWGKKEEAAPGAPGGGGNEVMHLNPEQVKVQQRLNEIQVCVSRKSCRSIPDKTQRVFGVPRRIPRTSGNICRWIPRCLTCATAEADGDALAGPS